MAKPKQSFQCESCGAVHIKWSGRCSQCGEWDSIKEMSPDKHKQKSWVESEQAPVSLAEIPVGLKEDRWVTQVAEFDRVVGGGVVPGSFGLLGGAPGVGKSTLILQLMGRFAKLGKSVLYVSGEESRGQIKQRADRLLVKQEEILVLIESNLEAILGEIGKLKPDFVVIDSIQTLYSTEHTASPGSVAQVRETAQALMQYAKRNEMALMLIGHVTKGGDLAGPRTLEHMVDYVLYLEGEKKERHRLLRAVKNRFGNVSEIGLFKMTPKGLAEVNEPNNLFVDRFNWDHAGTAVFAAGEGRRTLFLEVQVLAGDTQQSYPVRTATGVEKSRFQVLVAVLEKHLRMDFSRNDIYVNLAGGFKVSDPAMDMGLLAALLSSHLLKPLPEKSLFIGEVALTGEFRSVPFVEERMQEAMRCGFTQVYYPASVKLEKTPAARNFKAIPVGNVGQLLEEVGH